MKRATIITHNGGFHPDEVFALATLFLVEKRPTVIRTRDEKIIATGDYVVDVGGVYNEKKNLFDHHQQSGAGERRNKIPFASFGLVWKKFGEEICDSKDSAKTLDDRLVQYIDAIDNGVDIVKPIYKDVYPYMLGNIIFSYHPTWREKEKDESILDRRFLEAVQFAKALLEREVAKLRDYEEGKRRVERAYETHKDKRIIVLDHDYPWGEVLSQYKEPLLCVYPQEHTWHVKVVRDDIKSFKSRIEFPRRFAGKRDEELVKVTGVSDAIFCHNKRFMAVAKSREGAIALARKAIEEKHLSTGTLD